MTANVPACRLLDDPQIRMTALSTQLDTPSLGRVSYNPTYCVVTNVACSLAPALITNVVGLADSVLATVTTNGAVAADVSIDFSVISGRTLAKAPAR